MGSLPIAKVTCQGAAGGQCTEEDRLSLDPALTDLAAGPGRAERRVRRPPRAARRTIVEDRPVVIGIALLLLFAVLALWRSCVL